MTNLDKDVNEAAKAVLIYLGYQVATDGIKYRLVRKCDCSCPHCSHYHDVDTFHFDNEDSCWMNGTRRFLSTEQLLKMAEELGWAYGISRSTVTLMAEKASVSVGLYDKKAKKWVWGPRRADGPTIADDFIASLAIAIELIDGGGYPRKSEPDEG